MNKVLIFGAGRYGREIAQKIIIENTAKLEGFLDNYVKTSEIDVGGVFYPNI